VRSEKPNKSLGALAAGIALAGSLAAPLASAAMRARSTEPSGSGDMAAAVVDGVRLAVRSSALGSTAPNEGIRVVEPGHLREYRTLGIGRLLASAGSSAWIFGRRVHGSARFPAMDRHDIGRASPRAGREVIATVRNTTTPPAVRFPPWWSGICDVNNDPQSYPLSSWDGLTACGPGPNRGGYDVSVSFYPGAWGEFEWECVELSMRWLYLEYGVRPYSADGSQVVVDYSRADGGDLQQIANDGTGVPRPGDVMSMEPTSQEGHTAVVTGVDVSHGDGTVSILEQNMNGGNGTNTLGVVDNVVQPDDGMPVTGWLQAPAIARGPATARQADLVRDGGFILGDGGGWRVERLSSFATAIRSSPALLRPMDRGVK